LGTLISTSWKETKLKSGKPISRSKGKRKVTTTTWKKEKGPIKERERERERQVDRKGLEGMKMIRIVLK
jgi:hypothetical protein